MPTGTVKWFNTTKGFGFIQPDGGGKDIFVHISAVERAGMTGLADNQKVSYELIEGRDGRQQYGNTGAEKGFHGHAGKQPETGHGQLQDSTPQRHRGTTFEKRQPTGCQHRER